MDDVRELVEKLNEIVSRTPPGTWQIADGFVQGPSVVRINRGDGLASKTTSNGANMIVYAVGSGPQCYNVTRDERQAIAELLVFAKNEAAAALERLAGGE